MDISADTTAPRTGRLRVHPVPDAALRGHVRHVVPRRDTSDPGEAQCVLVFSAYDEGVDGFGAGADEFGPDADFGPRPTPASELPDPARFAAGIAQALLEIMDGTRSAANFARWFSPDVHDRLSTWAVEAVRSRWDPRTRSARPVLVQRRHVRRVRTCPVTTTVVEATVVVAEGDRCRSLALRLEGLDQRWRTTAVVVLP